MSTPYSFTIKPLHDRDGISLGTDEEEINLSMREVHQLIHNLSKVSHHVERRLSPPCPAPLQLAETMISLEAGPYETGMEWSGYIGQAQIGEENLDEIIKWCQGVKKYIADSRSKATIDEHPAYVKEALEERKELSYNEALHNRKVERKLAIGKRKEQNPT